MMCVVEFNVLLTGCPGKIAHWFHLEFREGQRDLNTQHNPFACLWTWNRNQVLVFRKADYFWHSINIVCDPM